MFRFAQHDNENFMHVAHCHCEQSEAINRHRIPMILASHTVGCHARTLCSLAMTLKYWRCDFSRTHYFICAVETAPPKFPFVMLSEAKHLFWIPSRFDSVLLSSFFVILFLAFFFKGDRGATCEAPPLSPLTIPQTPSRLLNVRCTCICHSPQRFVYVNMRT